MAVHLGINSRIGSGHLRRFFVVAAQVLAVFSVHLVRGEFWDWELALPPRISTHFHSTRILVGEPARAAGRRKRSVVAVSISFVAQ